MQQEAPNIPVGELPQRLMEINALKDKPVILVRWTDKRSANGAALFRDVGFRNLRVQRGGMAPGMMPDGTGALFGSRVTPVMNLSAEDVCGYLALQLDRLNNKRLKVGDINAEDGAIAAGIVTVDNSLVQRLKVDRRTGAIEYQN
ncbi:MAG: rhodanese-like domain-containing protein [Parvibaculum sp.]|nr:rhodanese-like domain-containing protein [Parvibaculum sp.]